MKYFLTGASSFVGNNVIRTILEHDANSQIEVLMKKRDSIAIDGLKVKKIFGNISTPESYAEHIDEETIVIHLSHLHDYSPKNKDEIFLINYEATRCLVDFCIKKHVKKFVYVSTVESICRADFGSGIVAEPNRFYPEKMTNPYATSKALAAYYVSQKLKTVNNFNAVVVYPTIVVGPNDYKPSVLGSFIRDAVDNSRQVQIKGTADFVDVRDVSEAIYSLANSDIRDVFILSGMSVSYDEINRLIADTLNKKLKILSGFARMTTAPYKNAPKAFYELFADQIKYSNKKARNQLEFNPRDISESIGDAVRFFAIKHLEEQE